MVLLPWAWHCGLCGQRHGTPGDFGLVLPGEDNSYYHGMGFVGTGVCTTRHVLCGVACRHHSGPPKEGWGYTWPNNGETRLVDVQNAAGFTPLHYAVWVGRKQAIQVGADPELLSEVQHLLMQCVESVESGV